METTSRCSPNDDLNDHPYNHLVIIGNGMASHRLVETLVKQPTRPQRITVIGAEPTPAYNRILLSPLLAGEMQQDALTLRDAQWYAEQGVTLILGEKVETLDRSCQTLTTDSGRSLDYDHLVIATGSRPALPDVPGIELAGVHGFRDLQDAAALEAIAQSDGDAVVIGGGLLGLEAAEGLRKRGNDIKVSVLQRSDRLMNRQLDTTAAHLLQDELTQRGLEIITGAQLARLDADAQGRVDTLLLADGRQLNATSVIIAAGITPQCGTWPTGRPYYPARHRGGRMAHHQRPSDFSAGRMLPVRWHHLRLSRTDLASGRGTRRDAMRLCHPRLCGCPQRYQTQNQWRSALRLWPHRGQRRA